MTAILVLIACAIPFRVAAQSPDPSTVGQWSSLMTWPSRAGHAHLLPNGKVLFWPTFASGNNPQIWDPATNTVASATKAGFNIFCSGHSFLADGKLFVTGGHITTHYGLPYATKYDFSTNSWSAAPNMDGPRWYPTNTTLANGDVLVMSGEVDPATGNDPLPEVYEAATNSWRDLSSAQLVVTFYPRMFLAPNGKVFFAGPDQPTRYLDTSGSGSWTFVGNRQFSRRDYGSAVMYSPGKIVYFGGNDPPTATVEVIDLNASTPTWRSTASMSNPRRQTNATVLPDGKVLVTGGSSGSGFDNSSAPVRLAELWDPSTESFTNMASNSVYRGYHSTALLLPDGRVLSAGGEVTNPPSAEVYSPPYLFKGARPIITSAPGSVGYGQNFAVASPDAASISTVSLIRHGSVTHALDQDQRYVSLSFSQSAGALNVIAPASGNVAPPGYYMLFLVNGNGVPSLAKIVKIVNSPVPAGNVTVAPTSLFVSNQVVGTTSAAKSIVVTNNQSAALTFNGISITGAGFAQTNNCPPQLGSNASCTISVTFAPTALGSVNGSITIADDASSSPQTVALSGAGIATTTLNPAALHFGNRVINVTTASANVFFKNNQTVPLIISSIVASGDFSQTNTCPSTLGPGAVCTLSVTFTPTALGTRVGAVTFTDSANDSPQTLSLDGGGVLPVTTSPTSLTFSSQTVGTTSVNKAITLKNNQTVPLTISSVVVSGDFAQTNSCPASLASRATCIINVTFKPTAIGTRTGTVTVTHNANNSPQTVNLTGTGR